MIIVIGHIVTKPEEAAAALKLSQEHVARSRTEPGCISHDVSVDAENSLRLVFVEYWQDAAALQTHFARQDAKNFVKQLSALVSERPVMKTFQAEEIPMNLG